MADRTLKNLEELLEPVLPRAEKANETKMTVRLSDSLKELLKAEAEARGLSLSDYTRSKLSSEIVPRHRTRQRVSRIERGTLAELNRIGSNLNQIARRLNSRDQSRVNQADRQLLAKLLEKLQEVKLSLDSEIKELEET
jgi:hypothetical protein